MHLLSLFHHMIFKYKNHMAFHNTHADIRTVNIINAFNIFCRSPAIVMAYLMKSKGWKLAQSYQWVKERRPSVELHPGLSNHLLSIKDSIKIEY